MKAKEKFCFFHKIIQFYKIKLLFSFIRCPSVHQEGGLQQQGQSTTTLSKLLAMTWRWSTRSRVRGGGEGKAEKSYMITERRSWNKHSKEILGPDKHFPKDSELVRHFNRNTAKVTYSTFNNMGSVISSGKVRVFQLCLLEKTLISLADPKKTFNKLNEIVSKCRHDKLLLKHWWYFTPSPFYTRICIWLLIPFTLYQNHI